MNSGPRALLIHAGDNVAVALCDLAEGDLVRIVGPGRDIQVRSRHSIPFAHKIAVQITPQGAPIIKYGVPVAYATKDIGIGEWVHTHNAGSIYARLQERGSSE